MADDIKTKRITEYEEATIFGDNDYIFVDNADLGTRKIKSTTIKQSLATEQQIAAINAAGQAARESIPETYTELSNSVDDLKSSLNSTLNMAFEKSTNLFVTKFESGSLANNTGLPTASTRELRTADFIEVKPQTVYIMWNARDKFLNVINPCQYLFEYDQDGNFLRYNTFYIASFTTGENTHKIKFRSGTYDNASQFLTDLNSYNIQLNEAPLMLKYESPWDVFPKEKSDAGTDSDNLFVNVYDIYGTISSGAWNYWGAGLSVVSNLIEVHGNDIWFLLDDNIEPFEMTYVVCYDSTCSFITNVTANVPYTSTEIYLKHAELPEGTKFIYIMSISYQRNDPSDVAAYEALKERVSNHFIVTENLEYARTKIKINNIEKIGPKDVNYGFHKAILNNEIRDFILDGLMQSMATINSTGYDAVIPVMSDIHSYWHEPYAILNYFARSGYCDLVCNLGDNVPDHYATKAETITFFNEVFNVSNTVPSICDVVNLQGNHDTNPVNSTISDGSNMIKNDVYYSLSKERAVKRFVSPKNYGYVDIENAKIRVVFLDTSDIFSNDGTPLIKGNNTLIQQEQLTWFANTALDFTGKADASEWSVITMAHERLSTLATNDIFGSVLEAFSTGTSLSITDSKTVDGYTESLSVDVDYSGQGAVPYICHVNGHYHEDNIVTFGNNFKQVTIPTDTAPVYYYDAGERKVYTRTLMTIQEHCFDFLCVDKKSRTIIFKRFGVGSDRTFTY